MALTILTVTGLVWAIATYTMSGVYLVDSNFEVLRDKLTKAEQDALLWSLKNILNSSVVPLGLVNILWFSFAALILKRRVKSPAANGGD